MFPDPHHYQLLKLIEANPAIQQREMARAMGVSLGKANYCLQALVQKYLVKSFLKRKITEYEAIRNEIEELRRDAERESTT